MVMVNGRLTSLKARKMKDNNGVPSCVYDQQIVLISSHSNEHSHTIHFKKTPLVERSSCLEMGNNGDKYCPRLNMDRKDIAYFWRGTSKNRYLVKYGCGSMPMIRWFTPKLKI